MDKTSSRIPLVPAPAADPQHAQPAEPPAEEALARRRRVVLAFVCLLRVGVIALMASSVAPSAWRARRDPVELAVAAGPCALLAAVFLCLHRAERLTPDSPPGERRRLHVAVWVLSTLIFCLVAYQVSRALPAALATAVCSVTFFFVLATFYMLVICEDQQYQDLDGVDSDATAAGDCKPFKTARPTDDLV